MNELWVCSQIGAREHYAVPRSLIKNGHAVYLFTDFWASPSIIQSKFLPPRMRQRYSPELETAIVHGFNSSSIYFEIVKGLSGNNGWTRILARNSWFQKKALDKLKKIGFKSNQKPVIFSYSYAALDLFRYAKDMGWKTILGQIDPGPVEEEIVFREHQNRPEFNSSWKKAPPSYWEDWRRECELADKIIVNSQWSEEALVQAGVFNEKIEVVPLVYECTGDMKSKNYPKKFSRERPLKVLFLGQVVMRKGIASILEAAELLDREPVEFLFVGGREIKLAEKQLNNKQIKWIGQVSRKEVERYYRDADIFLFPTLSDGFGLTQLEAQYWKLPIIASRYCGKVVDDGVNGLILDYVSAESITMAIKKCYSDPAMLQKMSDNSSSDCVLNLLGLSKRLEEVSCDTI